MMVKTLALAITVLSLFPWLAKAQDKVDVIDLTEMELDKEEQDLDNLESEDSTTLKVEEIVEPNSEYRYSSFGRKDPFHQPTLDSKKDEPAMAKPGAAEIPMVSPLQAYPLEQLKIKGVWELPNGQARAVVMTPKKEGIIIKKNDPISAGKVVSIARKKIVVRQYRLKADGSREFTDVEIPVGAAKNEQIGTIRLQPGKEPSFQRIKRDTPKPKRRNEVKKKAKPSPDVIEVNEPVSDGIE